MRQIFLNLQRYFVLAAVLETMKGNGRIFHDALRNHKQSEFAGPCTLLKRFSLPRMPWFYKPCGMLDESLAVCSKWILCSPWSPFGMTSIIKMFTGTEIASTVCSRAPLTETPHFCVCVEILSNSTVFASLLGSLLLTVSLHFIVWFQV